MARLHETIETTLPIDDAFAFVADFANAAQWDPGVAASERLDTGPLGLGGSYRLGVRIGGRVAPMVYRITTYEPTARVVLTGSGPNVDAIDEIRFTPTDHGTHIDYVADIRLRGWMRLLAPFAGGAFDRMAKAALGGMQAALDARASAAGR
jgi:carbon monoxide dehydrogenase subunit G